MSTVQGLEPYPTYKPFGIEWLDDVSTQWGVRRLKFTCRFNYGDSLLAASVWMHLIFPVSWSRHWDPP